MKIYTKTGDTGETGLANGEHTSKESLRVEAIGTADELNSHIGLLLAYLEDDTHREALASIQHRLFNLGSELALFDRHPTTEAAIQTLEQSIDTMTESLPALTQFILPTGALPSAQAQVCRAVSRRLERRIIALHHESPLSPFILQWVNRLSDYLFTLARTLNTETETFWNPENS